MSTNTTVEELQKLYEWLCESKGYSTTLVSDNGPQFTSNEFAELYLEKLYDCKYDLFPRNYKYY